MLHILLLILKWTGIFLLAVLLLAFLAVCLILFVPIRYKADVSCQNCVETLEANLEVSWMWKLIFLMVSRKDGKADLKLRVAWKAFFSEKGEHDESEAEFVTEACPEEQKVFEPPRTENEQSEKAENVHIKSEESEEAQIQNLEKIQRSFEKKADEKRALLKAEKRNSRKSSARQKKKKTLWERLKEKTLTWIERCRTFWEKLLAIGKKIREKKEQAEQFLCDASHQRAFRKLAKETKVLFRHLSPENVKIVGKIGLEDPYMTGQLLAVLGVLFPFLGENMVIVPDFENPVLEGSAHLEGKIQNVRILALVWRLVTDRDVRKIIIDIKKLK